MVITIAITDAIRKISTNKTRKGNEDIVLLLKEAYVKAADRDVNQIKYLASNNNPALSEQIYNLYLGLRNRQEQIKPLLPLYANGKQINFNFFF